MGLGLQRYDAVNIFYTEPVGCALVDGCELLNLGTLGEGHVVLVGRENLSGILLRCFLDEVEERRLHFLAVNNKSSAENLVAAVLAVNLRETEDFAVGERAAILFLQTVQVLYLLG